MRTKVTKAISIAALMASTLLFAPAAPADAHFTGATLGGVSFTISADHFTLRACHRSGNGGWGVIRYRDGLIKRHFAPWPEQACSTYGVRGEAQSIRVCRNTTSGEPSINRPHRCTPFEIA